MAGTICVVGSLNMDLVVATPRIPKIGESIIGSGFMTSPGGKGANQAVAAAKLGGQVNMVGCVGSDIFGHDLIKNLTLNGVKVDGVKEMDGSATGIAMIVLKDGDNFIIVDPGANMKLSPGLLQNAEQLVKGSSIMLIQLEIPQETVDTALAMARRNGVKVILNPAPARQLSDETLAMADVFTPNESECEHITGIKVSGIEDARAAADYLRKKGIPQVIVTLGSQGVVYTKGNEILHKPAYKVTAVDTTAAGDCFSGAMAVALSDNMDIDSAVNFASAAAALSVTRKGAQASLPDRKSVEEFMRSYSFI